MAVVLRLMAAVLRLMAIVRIVDSLSAYIYNLKILMCERLCLRLVFEF